MSTHNICFRGEIRKILCGYPLLSVAMICSIVILLYITQNKKGKTGMHKLLKGAI